MKNNIIIAGDSFCEFKNFWPKQVADALNLNLLHYGAGGCHWWSVKKFIDKLEQREIDDTQVVILCHTWTGRLPTNNLKLHSYDTKNLNENNKIENAINLYFEYIHEQEYAEWAEINWFKEFSNKFNHCKIINLFCFPWTIMNKNYLKGMIVYPSLASISLNEINAEKFDLFKDGRENHFSKENNKVLGNLLLKLIDLYEEKEVYIDVSKFNLLTKKWFDWK